MISWRETVKCVAYCFATVAVAPQLFSYSVRAKILGRDRALEGSTQLLSLAPGLLGQYLRRAFLCRVLDVCHRSVTVEFGTIFSKAGACIEQNVYVGPSCHLGLVHIERDVLVAAAVHIPSGPHTHGSADATRPMREQAGERKMIRIGAGAWIGSGAIVLADVGRESIIGAGAVVTRPIPDRVVAAGVPARVTRQRGQDGPEVNV